MTDAKRSCRTCVYWAKPSTARATSGRVFPCDAPLPALLLPESVTKAIGFEIQIGRRAYMERDEGRNCPVWTDVLPAAPTLPERT